MEKTFRTRHMSLVRNDAVRDGYIKEAGQYVYAACVSHSYRSGTVRFSAVMVDYDAVRFIFHFDDFRNPPRLQAYQ